MGRRQRQQELERQRISGIGRIGQGLRRPWARVLLTSLTSLWALWALASPAEDRFAQRGAEAIERRGLRGEEGLQREEILGARAVSRSVFAAQRAERGEAEAVGMTALAPALRRARQSLRRLRAVELEASMPRVQGAEDGESMGNAEAAASSEVEVGRAIDSGSGGEARAAISEPARRRALREARAVPFREACAGVLKPMEGLRDAASGLHSARQRMLAEGVLRRLETLEPMIEQAATAAMTPGAGALEELAQELGPPDDALESASTSAPDPTFVTRIRHRREIPRVP